jgi:hypothetical protein
MIPGALKISAPVRKDTAGRTGIFWTCDKCGNWNFYRVWDTSISEVETYCVRCSADHVISIEKKMPETPDEEISDHRCFAIILRSCKDCQHEKGCTDWTVPND